MKKIITVLSLMVLNTVGGWASPSSFIGVPVLVQEMNTDGSLANQFLDILQKNATSGNYEPQSTFYAAIRFFGMCLSETQPECSNTIKISDQMAHFLAVTSGRKDPDAHYLPPMSNLEVRAVTKVIEESEEILTIAISAFYPMVAVPAIANFKLKHVPELVKVKHSFSIPDKDEPDRRSIDEVEENLKNLSTGVLMLQTDVDTGDMVGAGGRDQGTGYFISSDGLMMTNHHVIDSFPDCMKSFSCEVNFAQAQKDGRRLEFRAHVSLLAMSALHDFALIKVKMPPDVQFSVFEIEKDQVGSDLVTLGFPADISLGQSQKTRLTYSFGKLVGFHGQTYATSNYIYGGASGSPLLNAESLKLVAILSNGVGSIIPGKGAPGLARPISLIDSEFGITDYLSGAKQSRLKVILKRIEDSQTATEVIPALDAYQAEKTFYGLPVLKLLMVNHSSKEVRKEIARSLQKMSILVGAKI